MRPRRHCPATTRRAVLRRAVTGVLVHGFLLAGAVFMLLPFVWMLITSIKPPDEIFRATLSLWPRQFYGVENYRFALTSAPLLRFAGNGVLVCACILAAQLLVAIPCAYALAKLRFPGRQLLFVLTLLVLAIPVQVPALPLYIALANLNLLNTYFSMMVPFFLSAFAIFLLRQFFKRFPTTSSTRRASTAWASSRSSGASSRRAHCRRSARSRCSPWSRTGTTCTGR